MTNGRCWLLLGTAVATAVALGAALVAQHLMRQAAFEDTAPPRTPPSARPPALELAPALRSGSDRYAPGSLYMRSELDKYAAAEEDPANERDVVTVGPRDGFLRVLVDCGTRAAGLELCQQWKTQVLHAQPALTYTVRFTFVLGWSDAQWKHAGVFRLVDEFQPDVFVAVDAAHAADGQALPDMLDDGAPPAADPQYYRKWARFVSLPYGDDNPLRMCALNHADLVRTARWLCGPDACALSTRYSTGLADFVYHGARVPLVFTVGLGLEDLVTPFVTLSLANFGHLARAAGRMDSANYLLVRTD